MSSSCLCQGDWIPCSDQAPGREAWWVLQPRLGKGVLKRFLEVSFVPMWRCVSHFGEILVIESCPFLAFSREFLYCVTPRLSTGPAIRSLPRSVLCHYQFCIPTCQKDDLF